MSGSDEKPPNLDKASETLSASPNLALNTVDLRKSTDLSVSMDGKLTDSLKLAMDAYATQVSQQPVSTSGLQNTNGTSPPTAFHSAQFPTDIPGFIVESELGRGAFGVVFCARDELLDRKVAIKKPLINNPIQRKQYIDEARKAVRLDHHGIVPIYQVGMTANDEPFVVQKLIEGTTLRVLLKNGDNRLPISQSIDIMRQVCLAVDAAHAAGIVHRDLKPENLLVEPDGRVYVADFGLAILEDDEQNKRGREVAGTPLYMSPEQFAGRVEWLDGRSDIWALGVIFYEILSGKTPFSGNSLNELKDQIRNKDPRPIHQRDPKIPPVFDAFFRKCCAKNVADRFASAREMIMELDAINASLPQIATLGWDLASRSSSGVQNPMGTESIKASQTWFESLGFSTHRKTQSTIRSSMGRTTISQPSAMWSLVGPVLTTLATLIAITSVGWFLKLGPFAVIDSSDKLKDVSTELKAKGNLNALDQSERHVSDVAEASNSTSNELKIVTPLVPKKPFRVAIKGNGTHESIAQAIAESDANDSITIAEGTYRESIIINRSIKLVGEGKVNLIATHGSCIKLQADSQVEIENVDFDCQAAKFNTVEIVGGRLVLKSCGVFATAPESYDCIKVGANAIFLADQCRFQSNLHAAVSGEPTSTMEIRNSHFSFSGTSDFGSKRAGIQATGAKGIIEGCTFMGPCLTGIDWLECSQPGQELDIAGCQFDNCSVGIQTSGCSFVSITGSDDQPCTIKNAKWGLSFKQSKAIMQSITTEGTSDKNKIGVQVTENSEVTCSNCEFRGLVCGVLVKQSSAQMDQILIRESSFIGMLVDGAKVVGTDLHLIDVDRYGLVVLSAGANVKLDTLEVQAASTESEKLTSAIYAASGNVFFHEGIFTNCLCGIFVDPGRIVINATMQPKRRSLIELMGDPEKTETTQMPVEVNGDLMTLNDCVRGWMFLGAGSSQIKQVDGNLPENKRLPQISPGMQLDLRDTTPFKIVVIPKT